MKTFLNIVFGILIGLLIAGVLWLATTSRPQGEAITLLPTSTPGMITVYITGAVATPGVYTLPVDSRLDAAVKAAGGFAEGAEEGSINLAQPLTDGQQVVVPGVVSTGHVNAGRVNINTATVTELSTLPGVGPTAAQAIVDYRLEHGPFQAVQDIQLVPGIGPATYDGIKDYITIGS
jgi:competence protein ComEA